MRGVCAGFEFRERGEGSRERSLSAIARGQDRTGAAASRSTEREGGLRESRWSHLLVQRPALGVHPQALHDPRLVVEADGRACVVALQAGPGPLGPRPEGALVLRQGDVVVLEGVAPPACEEELQAEGVGRHGKVGGVEAALGDLEGPLAEGQALLRGRNARGAVWAGRRGEGSSEEEQKGELRTKRGGEDGAWHFFRCLALYLPRPRIRNSATLERT